MPKKRSLSKRPQIMVLLMTASSPTEAKKITRALLDEKLVACVNLIPGIQSMYWWEGKIDQTKESLLILKTVQARVPAIIARVKQLHSYSVPEVLALPVKQGNSDYLKWVVNSI